MIKKGRNQMLAGCAILCVVAAVIFFRQQPLDRFLRADEINPTVEATLRLPVAVNH